MFAAMKLVADVDLEAKVGVTDESSGYLNLLPEREREREEKSRDLISD